MMKKIVCFIIFGIVMLQGCRFFQKDAPFVVDRAGLLTNAESEHINALLPPLLKQLDIHIQVVILKESPSNLDERAVELFETFALGSQTRGAKGVLFLIDPLGQQVRVEIGYDLEAIYPDAFIAYISHKQMTPFFQANQIGPGIEAAVELLVNRALGRIAASDYVIDETPSETQPSEYSGGAGARTTVKIGSGTPDKPISALAARFGPQPSPLQALEVYQEILRLHIKDPNLGVYTPETRKFFVQWVVTDAQQDNAFRQLQHILPQSEVRQQGNLAVIRYPLDNRQANPYFLRRGKKGWMLDFAAMNRTIGLNHVNQWSFRTQNHEFMFAFEDAVFDKNGFPHPQPR